MIWVTWRQQRLETLIGGAVLALVAALLLWTGLDMAATYQHTGVAACVTRAAPAGGCLDIERAFINQFEPLSNIFAWFNFLPLVFGMLLAAPFVLELEQGTYRLAWTQSITRTHWVAVKLGLIVTAAVVIALTLTALTIWWYGPLDHVQGQFRQNTFDLEGVAPLAYTVFAVALALATGTLLRRTIPALGLTLVGFLAVRGGLEALRPHYVSPVVRTLSAASPNARSSDWVIDSGWRDGLGHMLQGADVYRLCGLATGTGVSPACLRQHGIVRFLVYQPADRFWLFQGIEGAIYLGLAAGLLVVTVWWVRRRIA